MHQRINSCAMDSFRMVALGRPFSLGMFYDCTSDQLVPGITLWDKEKLDKDKTVSLQPNTECEIVASESISDKSSSLGVDFSLKASFLCELVKVESSAKYLNDNKKSAKQARVTLQYKTTTVFETLSMDQLGTGNLKHREVIDKGLATHVVTGILYGAQAFFVFDQETSDNESVQDIQGNLKAMINKIPKLSIGGSGALKMEDTEREKVNKFSCTFHGDFHLEKSPTTFEEAVKVYRDLPTLLGPNGEKAVPVTVYLLPLSALDSKASKVVRQISLRLVTETENVLENLGELAMWCNDVLNSPEGQNFSQLSQGIKSFKALCSEFKLGLQETLAQKLPSIRGGREEESALAEVLKKAAESPFSSHRLNQWIKDKDKEVNTIKTLMKLMKNTETVSSENALTDKVCDTENALVFVLTSLGSTEPFLSELRQYLRRSQSDSTDAPQSRRWYSSKDVIDSVRRKAKLFSDFAEANKDEDKQNIRFLVLGLEDEAHEGSAIYQYEEGFRVSEDFELPSKPAAVSVGEVTHSTVSLHFSAPSEGVQSITGYRVEFCEEGQEEWSQRPQAEAGAVTVTGLSPNTEYRVRVRAVTAVGVGPAAAPKTSIRTSEPCGPPAELTGTASSTRIRVRWKRPQVGQGVNIHKYIVEYGQMQEKIQWKRRQSQTEEMVISGLQPETTYTIRVLCYSGEDGTSLESSTLTLTTTAKSTNETVLEIPWRDIDLRKRDELLKELKDYKLVGASHVRILLFGPVGVGKSSFINSVGTLIMGRKVNVAAASACNADKSFTVEYKTHKFAETVPIVFNDLMGLEAGANRGVHPKDIKLAMKGHVKEKYFFNAEHTLSEDNKYFNSNPTMNDKVHVLVCMLDANAIEISSSVIAKMKEIREMARDLGIPQVAVLTHIDCSCEITKENIANVYKSKFLRTKMELFSQQVGIPIYNTYAVLNSYEDQHKDDADTLILTALKDMLYFGGDFIRDNSK